MRRCDNETLSDVNKLVAKIKTGRRHADQKFGKCKDELLKLRMDTHTHNLTQNRFYTQTLLTSDAMAHKLCCTQTLLHTDAFTHRRFTHKRFDTQTIFSHERFYTQTLPQTDPLAHRRVYIQTCLHTDPCAHKRFYKHRFLHTDAFTQILHRRLNA